MEVAYMVTEISPTPCIVIHIAKDKHIELPKMLGTMNHT